MRLLRYLLAPLTLLVLLAAGWYWRTPLVEYALEQSMKRFGLEGVEARVASLSPAHARLDALSFTDPESGLRIEARGMEAEYRIAGLLEGRVASVSVDSALVEETAGPPVSAGTRMTPLQALALLRGSWQERIPVEAARIGRLALRGKGFGLLDGEALSARLEKRASAVDARIELLDHPDSRRELVVKSEGTDRLLIELRSPGAAAAPAGADLHLGEKSLSGSVRVDLPALRRWLRPFAAGISLPAMEGRLEAEGTIAIEADERYAADLSLSSPGLRWRELETARLAATLAAVVDQGTLQTLDLELSGPQIRWGKIEVEGVDAKLAAAAGEDGRLAVDLDLDSPRVKWEEIEAEGVTAGITAVVGREGPATVVELEPKSRIAFRAWRQPELALGASEVDPPGRLVIGEEGWRLEFRDGAAARIRDFAAGALRSDTFDLVLAGAVSAGGASTRIRLEQGFEAVFAGFNPGTGESPVERLRLAPRQETTITLAAPASGETSTAWSFTPGKWLVESGTTDIGGLLLGPSPMQINLERLAGQGREWKLEAKASADTLLLRSEELEIPATGVDARISANPGKVELKGSLAPQKLPGRMTYVIRHDLTREKGSAVIDAGKGLDLAGDSNHFSLLLNSWPYPFDLVSGRVSFKGKASWSAGAPTRLGAELTVKEGGGHFQEAVFSGLDLGGEFELLPRLRTRRSARVKVRVIDFGIMLQEIETSVSLQPAADGPEPYVIADDLRGSSYKARFSSRRLIYNPNNGSGSLNLKLKGIDLAQMAKLAEMKELQTSGILDGYLPIRITPEGVRIEQGRLWSVPPGGHLSYRPAAPEGKGKKGSAMTDYVLRALRDYRYRQLAANLQFEPDGTLHIELQLKGISPGLDPRRPVHLNINLEQNLLSLLKSLRYTQGLNEKLDKEVQKRYRSGAELR